MTSNSIFISYSIRLPDRNIKLLQLHKYSFRSGGKWLFGGFAVYSVAILQYYMYMYRKYVRAHEIENRDANVALEPIFVAERNRMFLKRLVDNNEYEKEIMKDTPGWIPGTWYGSPIYHSKRWTDPNEEEFWAHTHPKTYYNQRMERHMH